MPGGSRRDPSRKVVSSDSSQPEVGRGTRTRPLPRKRYRPAATASGPRASGGTSAGWLAGDRASLVVVLGRLVVGENTCRGARTGCDTARLLQDASGAAARCAVRWTACRRPWAVESPPETSRVCSSSPGGGPQIGHGKGEGLLGLPKQARGVASSTISTSGGASRRSSEAD